MLALTTKRGCALAATAGLTGASIALCSHITPGTHIGSFSLVQSGGLEKMVPRPILVVHWNVAVKGRFAARGTEHAYCGR